MVLVLLNLHNSLDSLLKILNHSRPMVALKIILRDSSSRHHHSNLTWGQEESTSYFTIKFPLQILQHLSYSILLKILSRIRLEVDRGNQGRIKLFRWELLAEYLDKIRLNSKEQILPLLKDYRRLEVLTLKILPRTC
jgi:hypothetical protein